VNINPPLKWHGGKHYLAPSIVALCPPHVHYVEPFAGGLSVLLAKGPEGVSEVVNDLNGELMNFWRVLQDEVLFANFRRVIEATPFSEREWQDADDPSPLAWMQAVHFFIRCRTSLAGRMKSFAPLSRTRTRRGMNEQASAWLTAVEGLPAVHARLKRVVVLNHDALDVIREQDGPGTLFYCDPPYLHETRAGTDDYAYEMSPAQHAALLNLLEGIKGKFLLSGYPSTLYDSAALRAGWKRHDFDLPNNAAGGDSKRRMVECIWCNF
jgi:DNA adenine methylase